MWAVTTFEQEADVEALLAAPEVEPERTWSRPSCSRPSLVERACADRRTIVPRLSPTTTASCARPTPSCAAASPTSSCSVTRPVCAPGAAETPGLDIVAACVTPSTSDLGLLEKYSVEFARLRAKKGVTLEQAREKVQDVPTAP